jgi:hypothetical protein
MTVLLVLSLTSTLSTTARACPGELPVANPAEAGTIQAAVAHHAARRSGLLGAGDAFSTSLAARRVLREGREWTWVGSLRPAGSQPGDEVAAPYLAPEADAGPLVLATELLELALNSGVLSRRVSLAGRVLEVDGQALAVVTSYRVMSS